MNIQQYCCGLSRSFLLVLLSSCLVTCKTGGSTNSQTVTESASVEFVSPQSGQTLRNNDKVELRLKKSDKLQFDSVQFLANGQRVGSVKTLTNNFVWQLSNVKVGSYTLTATPYKAGVANNGQDVSVFVLPSQKAQRYSYRVINKWPHDGDSYTQGLLFDKGVLYEGSGLYGYSTLRTVDPKSGRVLKSLSLPSSIFGEGITIFDGKIIQLSWREHTAFLYDQKTFKQIKTFTYPTEGWGITFNGSSLIMSDGSANLYYMDKDAFALTAQLTVCDENGTIDRLNELEYINGEIWANVYTTDTILRIDPVTGAVLGKIDMSGLLKPSERLPDSDVLNGIAYEPESKRLVVTGKKWPWMYQIELIPVKD